MRVKFSGALVLAMACTGMCVFSAVPYTPMSENVWQGPATGGDWNANDNWSLAAPPSGERCFAKFTSSATVTPPADFVGVLWVSGNGVAVTADVPASASFALRLSNAESEKPSFAKKGVGTLRLKAWRGMNFGTVSVVEGQVDFAGNGETAAPGGYGKIQVAAGAQARVVDSPVATRHGAAVKAGFRTNNADYLPEGFGGFSNNGSSTYFYWGGGSSDGCGFEVGKESQSGFDRLEYMWDSSFGMTSRIDRCFVPTEKYPHLYGTNCIPQELFAAQKQTVTYTRALVLTGNDNYVGRMVTHDGSGTMSMVVRDTALLCGGKWSGRQYGMYDKWTRGFHSLLTCNWSESTYDWKKNTVTVSRTPYMAGDTGYLTEDLLWFGVCCNELSVAAGATLTVADGQALGLATTSGIDIRGSVLAGGAGAVVAVLSAYNGNGEPRSLAWPLPDGFAGYAGRIELGRTVWLRLPDTLSTAAWTLFGKGRVTVSAGSESRFENGWSGVVDVPAGVSFSVPAGWTGGYSFEGEGLVALSSSASSDSVRFFHGTFELPLNAGDELVDYCADSNGEPSVLLSSGTVSLSPSELWQRMRKTIPAPTDTSAWSYFGQSYNKSFKSPNGTSYTATGGANSKPIVQDGKLVLTYAADYQRHGVFLTSRPITQNDEFEISFTVKAYIPARQGDEVPPYAGKDGWLNDVRAGNFCLGITSREPGTKATVSGAPTLLPAGSQHLRQSFYEDGTSCGPVPYFGETQVGGLILGPQGGVNQKNPWQVTMHCKRGIARVTYSQGAISYSYDWDVRPSLPSGGGYLTLCGNSDWWSVGNVSVPWIRTEISDFSGWIVNLNSVELEEGGTVRPEMALSSANWTYNANGEPDSAVWPSEGTLMLFSTKLDNYIARRAVCKTPIQPYQAFKLEYDITYSASASTSTATLQAFCLQTEGSSPALTVNGNGLGAISLKNTPAYGMGTQTYDNYPFFWDGKGTDAAMLERLPKNSLAITANVANHVTIVYDGLGNMGFTYESNGKTANMQRYFRELAYETSPLYLTFVAATTWKNCGTIAISNLSFTATSVHAVPRTVFGTNLQVQPDADVTLIVGNRDRPPTSPQLSFQDTAFGDGASLTISPIGQDGATYIALENPTVAGSATLASATGATTLMSNVVFTAASPCSLTVEGGVAFSDPFGLVIPSTWPDMLSSGAFTLLDFAGATLSGDFPDTLVLTDDAGSSITSIRAVRRGDAVILLRLGMMMIFR